MVVDAGSKNWPLRSVTKCASQLNKAKIRNRTGTWKKIQKGLAPCEIPEAFLKEQFDTLSPLTSSLARIRRKESLVSIIQLIERSTVPIIEASEWSQNTGKIQKKGRRGVTINSWEKFVAFTYMIVTSIFISMCRVHEHIQSLSRMKLIR
jgi:hypothetical protein